MRKLVCLFLSLFSLNMVQASPSELKLDLLPDLLKSPQLVVIDVYADWCGPCRRFEPIFQQVSEQFSQQCAFFKLNGDLERELVQHFHVTAYPTRIYLKEGKEISRSVGCVSMSELVSELKSLQ